MPGCLFYICNIAKTGNMTFQIDGEILYHAFVTLRLDCCSSLLSGSKKPNWIQKKKSANVE